jgi:hypothetical protein
MIAGNIQGFDFKDRRETDVADKLELVKKFWAGFHNSVIIAHAISHPSGGNRHGH